MIEKNVIHGTFLNFLLFRYYPALKTLEQLEHIHLPTIAHYRFCDNMKRNLSCVRESIKEASMNDLKDFLENIRKYSPKIGEVAMKHVRWCNIKKKRIIIWFKK